MSEERDELRAQRAALDARLREARVTGVQRAQLLRDRQRLTAALREVELVRDRPVRDEEPEREQDGDRERPVREAEVRDARPVREEDRDRQRPIPEPEQPDERPARETQQRDERPAPEPEPSRPDPVVGPVGAAGVLLPLRLETRFDGPRLRIRIVPDEVWVTGHDPRPTRTELECLIRYVEERDGPHDREAWLTFARRVGGARANWLERGFSLEGDPGSVPMSRAREDDDLGAARVVGFPSVLEVWATWTDGAREPLTTVAVDTDALTLDLAGDASDGAGSGTVSDDGADPAVDAPARWWESFAAARKVGLGVEVDLGSRVDELEVLSVVGISEHRPGALFDAHRDGGDLGTIAPGEPIARVDGRAAVDRAPDAASRWEARTGPLAAGQVELSEALTGDPARMLVDGALPGGVGVDQESLVRALWPAVAGFGLHEVHGIGSWDGLLEDWAGHGLRPLGPLPTLRVGRQPYGVLPIAATHRWRGKDLVGHLEIELTQRLAPVRAQLAAAASERGTVEGVDAAGLLDRIGQAASSPELRSRVTVPDEIWMWMLALTGATPMPGPDWWGFDTDQQLGIAPNRRYASRNTSEPLPIPITAPGEDDAERDAAWPAVSEAIARLLDVAQEAPSRLAAAGELLEQLELVDTDGPRCLLAVLAVRSLQLAAADVVRAHTGDDAPLLEPTAAGTTGPRRLSTLLGGLDASLLAASTPMAGRFQRVVEGWRGLLDSDRHAVELGLRALLDTTSYRIDPWLTAPAYRRLRDLLDTADPDDPPLRLGAYGYVERPRPRAAGPTDGGGGLLLAPSDTQATTAAILRDRAVADPEPDRWQLQVTSDAVRDAARIATRVREGQALGEVVGQELESRVGDRSVIRAMRAAARRAGTIGARRPCDGLLLLDTDPDELPDAVRDDERAMRAIDALRRALETYADLLVAEGVHEVVEGRPDAAAAALDAAAGLAQPPTMDVIGTRARGRSIGTTSLTVLPAEAEPEPTARTAPGRIADPSVAAWLDDHLGEAADWTFEVSSDPGATDTRTISLGRLGLDPIDALAFPPGDVERLVTRAAFTASPEAEVVGGTAPARLAQARRLVSALGRPATRGDLREDPNASPSGGGRLDALLRRRLSSLRHAAGELAAVCRDEAEAATIDLDAIAGVRLAAWRWGLSAPVAAGGASDGASGSDGPDVGDPSDATDPTEELTRFAHALEARIEAAPDPEDPELETDDLVAAIRSLASRSGVLAVLAPQPVGDLPALTDAADLEEDWLPTVAAVRPRLARLEAVQLAADTPESGPALRAVTNRPDDVWQRDTDDRRRLVTAHLAPRLDLDRVAGDEVAVGVVDRFVEAVPAEEQVAAGAFGFHAPGARAPQAILVAVPPFPGAALDTYELQEVLVEVREAARARMVRPAELDDFAHLVPTALLPITGPTGFAGLQTVVGFEEAPS